MEKNLGAFHRMLRSLLGGALVALDTLPDAGLRWIRMVRGLLGFGPPCVSAGPQTQHLDRAVFVGTPPCHGEPTRLQWTRVEYRSAEMRRIETPVQVIDQEKTREVTWITS